MTQSIHNQIEKQIIRKRKGNIIFASDFKELGSGDAIRQVLSRLCREEFIIRLSTGIYENRENVRHDAALAPEWIAEIMLKFIELVSTKPKKLQWRRIH